MSTTKHTVRMPTLLVLLGLSLVLQGVTGCGGDDEERVEGMPQLGRRATPRPAPAGGAARAQPARGQVAAAEPATPIDASSAFPGVKPFVYSEGARDPFQRQYRERPQEVEAVAVLPAEEIEEREPGLLANYAPESLRLVAIVTRAAGPRAMFIVPDGSNRAVLAQQWDRVGPDGQGHIARIEPNQVIVEYEEYSFGPEGESLEHIIHLRPPGMNIEVCEENARFGIDCEAKFDRVD